MDKLALKIDVCEDDWTAEWAIIASNGLDNISSPEFAYFTTKSNANHSFHFLSHRIIIVTARIHNLNEWYMVENEHTPD